MKRIVVHRCCMCCGRGKNVLGVRCDACRGAGSFTWRSDGATRTAEQRVQRSVRQSRRLPKLQRYRTGGDRGLFA